MDRRQEGRRKHTAEQTQMNGTDWQTDERRRRGMEGMGRDATYSLGVCEWGSYMTYLGGDERAARSIEEEGREEGEFG